MAKFTGKKSLLGVKVFLALILSTVLYSGCASSDGGGTPGFVGHTPPPLRNGGRDYDQREEIDDDTLDFHKGNFDPYDPDPDGYF